jgi:glycosyltransferase involved in cell wall biosynthesis
MSSNPQAPVAVLMTAYKAEGTINEAIDSILSNGSVCDILVVDDCSPVPMAESVRPHPRVEILRLSRNGGPGPARNFGLEQLIARNYRYIAIMDADDIALPGKFAKQLAFLEKNPRVGAVGTWARFFDENTRETLFFQAAPTHPDEIRQAIFFNLPMVHPSVMMRTDVFKDVGFYDPRYRTAEDYELMRRVSRKYDLANLGEYLFDYRMSSRGQSLANRRKQLGDRLKIQIEYFEPKNWRAWAGVAQTLVLFVMPVPLVLRMKRWLYSRLES